MTCAVADCPRGVKTLRICNAHYLRAKRSGSLDELLATLPVRRCAHCNVALPLRARSTQQFCSRRCVNAAAWSADPEGRKAAQRAWVAATAGRRREALLRSREGRACPECGSPIPVESWARRKFCSRTCINQRSLREAKYSRREADRRYRARSRAAGGAGVSERDWLRLVSRHRGKCAYCGEPGSLTVDHVVPISRGGQHSIGNVLPACGPCNSSKSHLLLADWKRRVLPLRLAA